MSFMSSAHPIRHRARAFLRCSSGVAFIEFAVAVPLLILLFFGGIEITRYILIAQKMDRATSTIGEVVTSNHLMGALSGQYIPHLLNAIPIIMYPYTNSTNYVEYISNISYPVSASPIMNWQCKGGVLSQLSKIGLPGGVPNLSGIPGGFSINPGEEFIITETYYQYAPITTVIGSLIGLPPLYRVAVFVPRAATVAGAILPGPQCTEAPPS
jgi:hypothetical protein